MEPGAPERRKRHRGALRPTPPKRKARHVRDPLPRGKTGSKTLQEYRTNPNRTYRQRGYPRAPHSKI